jgi:hypothetical protein
MRYSVEFLSKNEFTENNLRNLFNTYYDLWNSDTGVSEDVLYSTIDLFPEEWIANTYLDRFKYYNYDRARYLFAEQIILPYCIKRGILIKKKGAKDYEFVGENAGRIEELDFN